VLNIDVAYNDHLEAVTKSPVFAEAIGRDKWSFALVEIDKLVCFQKYIDIGYSEETGGNFELGEMQNLMEFCLPLKPPKKPLARSAETGQYAFTISSANLDLRILGMVQQQDPLTKRSIFGFPVGWGIPFIQIVRHKNRCYLKNGYHRVYALRRGGITHVPCILIESDDYAQTGAARQGFFGTELLLSEKPPIFAHFLSDELAPELEMHSLIKVVRIKAEEFLVPGMSEVPSVIAKEQPAAIEPKPESTENEYEDFEIVREGWNVYRLPDGTVLRLRQLLVRLHRDPKIESSESGLQIQSSSMLMAAQPPARLRGPPSSQQYSIQELNSSLTETNLRYETVREVANEYKTASGIRILIRLANVTVSRTTFYDKSGEPIYVVNSETVIEVIPPTEAT